MARRGNLVAGGLITGLVLACGPAAAPAFAQAITVRSTSPLGGGPGGTVTKRSIDRYAEVLAMSPEQAELARTIHAGYTATCDAARKTQREAMEDLRRSADDSGDHSVFMEKMPAIQSAYRKATSDAEKSLMSDIRALLSPEQEPRWPAVERMRRRETQLRGGFAGENVDLVEVVRQMTLGEEVKAQVDPILADYELDMDRVLAAKEASSAGDFPQLGRGRMEIDVEAMQKRLADAKESSMKVVDVNNRTAEKIKAVLPDDLRERFAKDYKVRSFPRVYRQSRVSRGLDAALGFTDLDAGQREALQALKASYDRDLESVNARWADAQRESEQAGQAGGVALPGGGRMMLSMGDEPEALKAARTARRELDDRANERLKSILRTDQAERLPKAPPPGEGGEEWHGEGGDAQIMMITTEEVRGGPR